MTRNISPRRAKPIAVPRSTIPAITRLSFTMYRFEGDWPVVVMRSRNAMAALQRSAAAR